jgi:hypothetical protein
MQTRTIPATSSARNAAWPRPVLSRRHLKLRASSSAASNVPASVGGVPDANVVIIGGTGRVGSSTASALLKSFPNLNVTLASRSKESYSQALSRRPELSKAGFQTVDITNAASVKVTPPHRQLNPAPAQIS